MDNNNLYKHIVDLYDNNPVIRKEYLIVLVIYSLITLLFYFVPIKFVSALAGLVLVLFFPLLFIATFNRLKNTIITTIPAFILSFLIPYIILVLQVSTEDLEMIIPLEKYYNIIFLVYFPLLFLSGLILPVSKKIKEINYEKINEDNKKSNLLHIFNDLITLNLKASINKVEYITSCILAFILPICMLFLSYILVTLLRIFYRSNLNAANRFTGDGPFVLDVVGPYLIIFISFAVCAAITIILFFLLFILRLNDITNNFYIKFSIITAYIILLAAGIKVLIVKDNLAGIFVYAISLFIIPAFINGKSIKKQMLS